MSDGKPSGCFKITLAHPVIHLLLEGNDLLDPLLDELPLGDDQLLPVLGRLVEEPGVHLVENKE